MIFFLYSAVQINKFHTKPLGEGATDSGLAGTGESDQHYVFHRYCMFSKMASMRFWAHAAISEMRAGNM